VTITLTQRSNQIIPGSNGVRLIIDDVTRGQVMVSLAAKDGSSILAPRSMTQDATVNFRVGSESYTITLTELKNALLGVDHATFVIKGPASTGMSETAKIEALIAHVESLNGAVFIRNKTEHPPKEAAAHLRTKWNAVKDQIATARDFIDKLATSSSTSNEPYTIRLSDGKTRPAGEYLHEQLQELEKPPPTPSLKKPTSP